MARPTVGDKWYNHLDDRIWTIIALAVVDGENMAKMQAPTNHGGVSSQWVCVDDFDFSDVWQWAETLDD